MTVDNHMQLKVRAVSENESFIRCDVGAFCVDLNPTVEELNDIKTAVSEAVTNSVVHGYANGGGDILVEATVTGSVIHIDITDYGVGIPDVGRALEPFYTTRPEEERSGMGFTVMQAFMDTLEVSAAQPSGVRVSMSKAISGR